MGCSIRTTHTHARLAVPAEAYEAIALALRDAGALYAFNVNGHLDMCGISLVSAKAAPALPKAETHQGP